MVERGGLCVCLQAWLVITALGAEMSTLDLDDNEREVSGTMFGLGHFIGGRV